MWLLALLLSLVLVLALLWTQMLLPFLLPRMLHLPLLHMALLPLLLYPIWLLPPSLFFPNLATPASAPTAAAAAPLSCHCSGLPADPHPLRSTPLSLQISANLSSILRALNESSARPSIPLSLPRLDNGLVTGTQV